MKFKPMTSGLFLLAASLAVHAAETPTNPVAGPGSSGGGHSGPNGDLFDYYENEGSVRFNPLLVPGVKEALDDVQFKVPGLSRVLRTALGKKWYFESKPLKPCPGGESLVLADQTTVACQSNIQIRISKTWYDDSSLGTEKTARKQKGIILHELGRAIVLAADGKNKPDEDMLSEMTRVLSEAQTTSEIELRDTSSQCRFGNFRLGSEIRVHNQKIESEISQVSRFFDNLILIGRKFDSNQSAPQYLAFYQAHKVDYEALSKKSDDIRADKHKSKKEKASAIDELLKPMLEDSKKSETLRETARKELATIAAEAQSRTDSEKFAVHTEDEYSLHYDLKQQREKLDGELKWMSSQATSLLGNDIFTPYYEKTFRKINEDWTGALRSAKWSE